MSNLSRDFIRRAAIIFKLNSTKTV